MKMSNGTIRKLAAILTLTFALLFSSCQEDTHSPLDVSSLIETNRPVGETIDGRTIQFIPIAQKDSASLHKLTTVSKYITRKDGGDLQIDANGAVKADIKLEVEKHSIDFDKTISMSFDDAQYQGISDVVFGPHGTQFSSPAFLTIKVKDLDLSGLEGQNIGLYYVNDNGTWEEMVCEEIKVTFENGEIEVIRAELHHFSRYALAAD